MSAAQSVRSAIYAAIPDRNAAEVVIASLSSLSARQLSDSAGVIRIDWQNGIIANDAGVTLVNFSSDLSLPRGAAIAPRVTQIASSATPVIDTDTCDFVDITALAAAITSMTTNLSGAPTNGQRLTIRIKDDGNSRAITWGASFENIGGTLPTTTTPGKRHTVQLIYDTTALKWGCVAAVTEA